MSMTAEKAVAVLNECGLTQTPKQWVSIDIRGGGTGIGYTVTDTGIVMLSPQDLMGKIFYMMTSSNADYANEAPENIAAIIGLLYELHSCGLTWTHPNKGDSR